MKKILFVSLWFVIANVTNCLGQVTIGSNSKPNATLDVRSQGNIATSHDGIIAPKLTGDQLAGKDRSAYGADQDGAIVYVTAAASAANLTGETANVTEPGYYYYNYSSDVWLEFGQAASGPEWFYMPPSLINTDPGSGKTIDLFDAYNKSVTNSITSTGATRTFPVINPVLTRNAYNFYVLGYDATLFANISIDIDGVMTYDIIGRSTNESYITIAFAKKN